MRQRLPFRRLCDGEDKPQSIAVCEGLEGVPQPWLLLAKEIFLLPMKKRLLQPAPSSCSWLQAGVCDLEGGEACALAVWLPGLWAEEDKWSRVHGAPRHQSRG